MNNLSERAMLVSLEISNWGNRCVDKEVSEEVTSRHSADKNAGTFSKNLLNKKHLGDIIAINNKARKLFKENTLAWSDRKARLLPSNLFSELSKTLADLKDQHSTHVEEFLNNYDHYISEAQSSLNGLFNIKDYPSLSELQDKFKFDYSFDPLSDPKDFRCSIDESLKQQIQEDIKRRTEEKYNAAINKLWLQLSDVIAKFNEKLADEDAKFKNTLVYNITNLVDLLPSLNVMDDPKLNDIANRINKELCVFDPESLRHDKDVRKQAVDSSKEILDTIGAMYAN